MQNKLTRNLDETGDCALPGETLSVIWTKARGAEAIVTVMNARDAKDSSSFPLPVEW
jgi:hypothetical protein